MSQWVTKKLGDFIQLQRGFDITKAEQNEGVVPIVSSSGTKSYHNKAKVEGPGVVTGRKGTLGKVHYVKDDFWPHDTTLWVKDFKGNSPLFVYYYLSIMNLEKYDTGSSNPTLNRNHIHKIDCVLPKTRELQNQIAAVLSAYDDLIENNNRRIALLEKSAEELYKEWFVRMRFPGYESTKFEKGIPEGWEVKRITEIVDFLSGFSFKSQDYVSDGKYGLVTIKNVQDGFFIEKCTDYIVEAPARMKDYCYLHLGDVLMSLTGNVGRVCRVTGDVYLLNQRVAKLKPLSENSSQFIYFTFKNRDMVKLIENLSLGSTAQMNLSPIQLGKQKMVVPSDVILEKFEEFVLPIKTSILQLLQSNNNLKTTRDRLLTRLISGKLSVEDLAVRFPKGMER